MALLARAATLCRLALRTPWAAVRLLSSTAGGELPPGEDKPGRRVDLEALRRERAQRPPSIRPPAALPGVGFSPPRPSREQLQLNRALTTCGSIDEVLDLVAARWALMNCVIVSTALSVIARLAGKHEPALWLKDDERFRQLLRSALLLMERQEMDAQGFSNILYACGQLGTAPPTSWFRAYWNRSAAVIGDFVPQALSNMVYACGQLGITPSVVWLDCYWHASALKLGDFDPQGLSNTLYACGQLGISPPADWLERYWHACALKLGVFKPQDFSNTLHACGQLGITPPLDMLGRFWLASVSKLIDFVPQALSNTLYVCGRLSIVPPAEWLERYWHASAVKLVEFDPQALSNTVYACGKLGIVPPDEWLERYWDESAATLGEWIPQDLSNTLFACGLLDTRPPTDWLELFSGACEQALPAMNQQNLANTALSLAMLQLWELPLWRGLWEHLCSSVSRNVAGWSAEDRLHAIQMYQAYQAAAVERPGLLPAPSPELLADARKSWIDQAKYDGDNVQAGTFHSAVSVCLTRIGVLHANERWCDRAERSIDIAIEGASVPVALEVDGPFHFRRTAGRTGARFYATAC
jgi:hypothetical protein